VQTIFSVEIVRLRFNLWAKGIICFHHRVFLKLFCFLRFLEVSLFCNYQGYWFMLVWPVNSILRWTFQRPRYVEAPKDGGIGGIVRWISSSFYKSSIIQCRLLGSREIRFWIECSSSFCCFGTAEAELGTRFSVNLHVVATYALRSGLLSMVFFMMNDVTGIQYQNCVIVPESTAKVTFLWRFRGNHYYSRLH